MVYINANKVIKWCGILLGITFVIALAHTWYLTLPWMTIKVESVPDYVDVNTKIKRANDNIFGFTYSNEIGEYWTNYGGRIEQGCHYLELNIDVGDKQGYWEMLINDKSRLLRNEALFDGGKGTYLLKLTCDDDLKLIVKRITEPKDFEYRLTIKELDKKTWYDKYYGRIK